MLSLIALPSTKPGKLQVLLFANGWWTLLVFNWRPPPALVYRWILALATRQRCAPWQVGKMEVLGRQRMPTLRGFITALRLWDCDHRVWAEDSEDVGFFWGRSRLTFFWVFLWLPKSFCIHPSYFYVYKYQKWPHLKGVTFFKPPTHELGGIQRLVFGGCVPKNCDADLRRVGDHLEDVEATTLSHLWERSQTLT